jgi:hypothetical protein
MYLQCLQTNYKSLVIVFQPDSCGGVKQGLNLCKKVHGAAQRKQLPTTAFTHNSAVIQLFTSYACLHQPYLIL